MVLSYLVSAVLCGAVMSCGVCRCHRLPVSEAMQRERSSCRDATARVTRQDEIAFCKASAGSRDRLSHCGVCGSFGVPSPLGSQMSDDASYTLASQRKERETRSGVPGCCACLRSFLPVCQQT